MHQPCGGPLEKRGRDAIKLEFHFRSQVRRFDPDLELLFAS